MSASALFDGEPANGNSQAEPPVPSGLTDVGTIVISTGAVVGYYDLSRQTGNPIQVAPIVTAGFDAVSVGNLDTAVLAAFDILFVQNPSNSSFGVVWPRNLQKVSDFVAGGGILVFHDRQVGNAEVNLPGNPGNIIRNFSDARNIDVVDNTTCVTDGPGGIVGNTTLDGGNSSSHGFAFLNTLPPGARAILSTGDPTHIVTYSYPHGNGHVVYSSIPLDFYLNGSSPAAFRFIYSPNVVCYANDLRLGRVGP